MPTAAGFCMARGINGDINIFSDLVLIAVFGGGEEATLFYKGN